MEEPRADSWFIAVYHLCDNPNSQNEGSTLHWGCRGMVQQCKNKAEEVLVLLLRPALGRQVFLVR